MERAAMPLLMIFLESNWKVICLGAIITIFGGFMYHKGAVSVKNEWDLVNLQAITKARQIEHDNATITAIIEGKHYAGIKAIDDNFNAAVASLQQPASSDLPSKTKTTSKPDAATCDNKFYRANKRKLLEIAKQADIQTEQLIRLQEWEQGIK
jgi:hypothetical protein